MKKIISFIAALFLAGSAFAQQLPPSSNPNLFTVTGANGNSLTLDPSYIPNNTNIRIYGALHPVSDTTSLTYSVTGSAAAVTGSTALVISQPGTYILTGIVSTNFSGATFAAVQNVTCYLDRTNNTPAIITNTTGIQLIPIVTTITLTGPTIQLGPVSYTTSNTTDSISVFCSVSTIPSAGNFQVTATHISAVRIGQ